MAVLPDLSQKHEYEKTFHLNSVKIYPKIVLFKNGEKIKVIDGFQNYQNVYEQLAL